MIGGDLDVIDKVGIPDRVEMWKSRDPFERPAAAPDAELKWPGNFGATVQSGRLFSGVPGAAAVSDP